VVEWILPRIEYEPIQVFLASEERFHGDALVLPVGAEIIDVVG